MLNTSYRRRAAGPDRARPGMARVRRTDGRFGTAPACNNHLVQGPTRIAYGASRDAPFALIGATAATALLFAATPWLIGPIADRYGVTEGAVGAVSVVQVGAFALANFLLPRLLAPNGRILRISAASLVALNLLSAIPNIYAVLLVVRFAAGFAAGAMTWLAWGTAMKKRRSMASIAATGPVTALLGAPVLAMTATQGDRAVYLLLAVAAIPAAVIGAHLSGARRVRGNVSRSRSNRVLLAALGGLTMFGSALFINEAIVARDMHHLSEFAASIGFSLNAAGGLLGARLSTRHRRPGWFLASIGPAGLLTVVGPTPFFFIGLAWWGFAFWMGIPGVLQMLSERSLNASERAGDAQGLMAVGRSFGPIIGGAFVDLGSLISLSVITCVGTVASGLTVIGVQEGRELLPPTDPRTVESPG
jgi:MFS family permease